MRENQYARKFIRIRYHLNLDTFFINKLHFSKVTTEARTRVARPTAECSCHYTTGTLRGNAQGRYKNATDNKRYVFSARFSLQTFRVQSRKSNTWRILLRNDVICTRERCARILFTFSLLYNYPQCPGESRSQNLQSSSSWSYHQAMEADDSVWKLRIFNVNKNNKLPQYR